MVEDLLHLVSEGVGKLGGRVRIGGVVTFLRYQLHHLQLPGLYIYIYIVIIYFSLMTTKRFGILLHTVVGLPRWVVGIRRRLCLASKLNRIAAYVISSAFWTKNYLSIWTLK